MGSESKQQTDYLSQSLYVADTEVVVAVGRPAAVVVVAVVARGASVAVYSTPLAEPP